MVNTVVLVIDVYRARDRVHPADRRVGRDQLPAQRSGQRGPDRPAVAVDRRG